MTSPDPSIPEQSPPPPRRLRRTSDRRVAGVAGGLAEQFGLDATLVRVAFVVLAFFGGAGLAAYVVGAFVIPDEEGAPALGTRATVVLVAIGIAALLSAPVSIVLLLPVAIGVLVWRAFGGRVPGGLMRAAVGVVVVTGSILLGLAAGLAAAFGAGTAIAVAALVMGAVLILAGLRGGARWLIVPALALAIPATVVAAADLSLEGGVGDREYRPAGVSELRSHYRLGAGELRLDLRDLRLAPGQEVATDVRVGVGVAEVTVPPGVCVIAQGHVGVGVIDLLGRVNEGADVDDQRGGAARPGAPVLRLNLHAGMGELVVDRDPDGGHGSRLLDDGCTA